MAKLVVHQDKIDDVQKLISICPFGAMVEHNGKVLVIEEAWKAVASPMMAEYIQYLYKTA